MRKLITSIVTIIFTFFTISPPAALAQSTSTVTLPAVGTSVSLSESFAPPLIKGVILDPENPLVFDFLVRKGQSNVSDEQYRDDVSRMVKYFLSALTTAEDDLWVNLSPYEKNRIVPETFGQTQMGRDLLAQDYLLKQLSASLMNPDEKTGREFWEKINVGAQPRLRPNDSGEYMDSPLLNKIWIVPEKASVYEHAKGAYVVDSTLKVMLEEDYLALKHHTGINEDAAIDSHDQNALNIMRETIVPVIQKEVNEGKHFAKLRQIYHTVILATWYKQALRKSLLGEVYVNQGLTKGVDYAEKDINQKIYDQYVASFKEGVYDFIKEEYDEETQSVIPRKYFSGGADVEIEELGLLSGQEGRSEVLEAAREDGPLDRYRVDATPETDSDDDAMTSSPISRAIDYLRVRHKYNVLEEVKVSLSYPGKSVPFNGGRRGILLASVNTEDAVPEFLDELKKLFGAIEVAKGPGLVVEAVDAEEKDSGVVNFILTHELHDGTQDNVLNDDETLGLIKGEIYREIVGKQRNLISQLMSEPKTENLEWLELKQRIGRIQGHLKLIDPKLFEQFLEKPVWIHRNWLDVDLLDQDGKAAPVSVFVARVQNNNIEGPTKGGMRMELGEDYVGDGIDNKGDARFIAAHDELNSYHADLPQVKQLVGKVAVGRASALAGEMTGKGALNELKLGGGKAVVLVVMFVKTETGYKMVPVPKSLLTPENKARIFNAVGTNLAENKIVGVDRDIPAPDMRTGPKEMEIMTNALIRYIYLNRTDPGVRREYGQIIAELEPFFDELQAAIDKEDNISPVETPLTRVAADAWLGGQDRFTRWVYQHRNEIQKTEELAELRGRLDAVVAYDQFLQERFQSEDREMFDKFDGLTEVMNKVSEGQHEDGDVPFLKAVMQWLSEQSQETQDAFGAQFNQDQTFDNLQLRMLGDEVARLFPFLGAIRDEVLETEDVNGFLTPMSVLGVYTGKSPRYGGMLGRKEATGKGVVHVIETIHGDLTDVTAAIQGFGNVARYAALEYVRRKGKLTHINDIDITLVKEEGWTESEIEILIQVLEEAGPNVGLNAKTWAELVPAELKIGVKKVVTGKVEARKELLSAPVEILIPAATQNQLDETTSYWVEAKHVYEGANTPVTNAGEEILDERGIHVWAGQLVNAGGVTISSRETVQALSGQRFVPRQGDDFLEEKMQSSARKVLEVVQREKVSSLDAINMIMGRRLALTRYKKLIAETNGDLPEIRRLSDSSSSDETMRDRIIRAGAYFELLDANQDAEYQPAHNYVRRLLKDIYQGRNISAEELEPVLDAFSALMNAKWRGGTTASKDLAIKHVKIFLMSMQRQRLNEEEQAERLGISVETLRAHKRTLTDELKGLDQYYQGDVSNPVFGTVQAYLTSNLKDRKGKGLLSDPDQQLALLLRVNEALGSVFLRAQLGAITDGGRKLKEDVETILGENDPDGFQDSIMLLLAELSDEFIDNQWLATNHLYLVLSSMDGDTRVEQAQQSGMTVEAVTKMRKQLAALLRMGLRREDGKSDPARELLVEILEKPEERIIEEKQFFLAGNNGNGNGQDHGSLAATEITDADPKKVGGIDLNPKNMNLDIGKHLEGFVFDFEFHPVRNMDLKGFSPVIINVAPVTNLPLLLGLQSEPVNTEQDRAPTQKAKEPEENMTLSAL